jgi:hypothetical protein
MQRQPIQIGSFTYKQMNWYMKKYHSTILDAMQLYKDNASVEGLLFNYLHFYGSYKYVGDGRAWYSKENSSNSK